MSGFLNSNEQQIVDELDRFVNSCKANGWKPREITISRKQANALKRVLEKTKDNTEYDYAKKFDLNKMTFRGIKLCELPKLSPYHRRKSMMELFPK